MRLYIEGPVNKYYVQTLCMIFFPGSKFSADEPVTEDTPEMWVRMSKSAEAGIDVTARLSYRGQSAEVSRHYDYAAEYTAERYKMFLNNMLFVLQKQKKKVVFLNYLHLHLLCKPLNIGYRLQIFVLQFRP